MNTDRTDAPIKHLTVAALLGATLVCSATSSQAGEIKEMQEKLDTQIFGKCVECG